MTCHYRHNDSSTLLACVGKKPVVSDGDVQVYAGRVGSGDGRGRQFLVGGGGDYVYNFVLSCLRINRLMRPDIPEGPCGSTHYVPTGFEQGFSAIRSAAQRDP